MRERVGEEGVVSFIGSHAAVGKHLHKSQEHEKGGKKRERETLTASCQPAEVDIVIFDLLRVDEQKDLFCLLKVSCGRLCLSVVEVEHIIIEVVALCVDGHCSQHGHISCRI